MCAVSVIGDYRSNRFNYLTAIEKYNGATKVTVPVDREEFNKLKNEVESLKILLLQAKDFDERTNQPECHDEEKVKILKAVAEALGVDISAAFE